MGGGDGGISWYDDDGGDDHDDVEFAYVKREKGERKRILKDIIA